MWQHATDTWCCWVTATLNRASLPLFGEVKSVIVRVHSCCGSYRINAELLDCLHSTSVHKYNFRLLLRTPSCHASKPEENVACCPIWRIARYDIHFGYILHIFQTGHVSDIFEAVVTNQMAQCTSVMNCRQRPRREVRCKRYRSRSILVACSWVERSCGEIGWIF